MTRMARCRWPMPMMMMSICALTASLAAQTPPPATTLPGDPAAEPPVDASLDAAWEQL
ncbi:MAG: hypothetical protein HKO59_03870, partial [Phycisphaerales bacterium]|nr:hypothetical protein [Phycisphaerales bacterium]